MKILSTADWHIRSTVPGCLDMSVSDWMEFQRKSLERVGEIAVEMKADEIDVGGDLFHSEQTSSYECVYMIQEFSERMYRIGIRFRMMAGNHDLINHSSSNLYRSAIGVLMNSRYVEAMDGTVRGCNFDEDDYGDSRVIFKHVLTIPKNDVPFAGIECETPESLLEKYPRAEVILTGDYHRNFEYHMDGRHVFNSGCLTRQASDFESYEPGVYVVDLDNPSDCRFVKIGLEQKFNRNGAERKLVDESVEKFVAGIKKESVTLDYIGSLRNELREREDNVKVRVEDWIGRSGN